GHREVEVGARDGVRGTGHLGDLVGPPGVPDPAVDRGVDRGLGGLGLDALARGDLLDELAASALEELGDAVEDLSTVVRRRAGPPGLGLTSGDDGLAGVLAGGERSVREEGAVVGRHLVGATRLAAGELPADEELVRLANVEAGAHRALPSARYAARPWRPPSRP